MAHRFDPGYAAEPYRSLCEDYPGDTVYLRRDFRLEWGPIFHRGRLDGTARVLVIGQDPALHEAAVRRILVGAAGRRAQGFLRKLGFDRSYVLINAYLYGVYGGTVRQRYRSDPAVIAYRHLWLDALLGAGGIEAVVALGSLAGEAWAKWKATPRGQAVNPAYRRVFHPTFPESTGDVAANTRRLLRNWNQALQALRPAIQSPDLTAPLVPYGNGFAASDLADIPDFDLPAGLPAWMRERESWAERRGRSTLAKRRNLTVTVPRDQVP